ncbi:hypothetical protein X737_16715 [Mesorhizobium sp. L48C026A00]|nr:hypothetical protein X737_16715 [Mesorhizobium sp. L48C026A00]
MGTIAPSRASTTAVTMMRDLSMCASLHSAASDDFARGPPGSQL